MSVVAVRLVVYVVRRGSVESFVVEGGEAEELLRRLEELERRGLVKRGRLEPSALRL